MFQTWENLREHWRLNYHPGDDVLHRLDDDARKLMNGTAIFAEIGFYGHRNGETIHHCARLVVVDDWYGSGKKKQGETWAPTDARAIYRWNRLERSN